MKWILIFLLCCGNLSAKDFHWSFNTLVEVMEDKGFEKWQRGDKLFMKGLKIAKVRGVDVTESGVMDSLVIKHGGFYFKKDPVGLNFEKLFNRGLGHGFGEGEKGRAKKEKEND